MEEEERGKDSHIYFIFQLQHILAERRNFISSY